jgi:release factor glutamine methyltransferase
MSTPGQTYAQALAAARRYIPAAEARLLMSELVGQSAAWLIAHDNDVLRDDLVTRFHALVARRAAGEPVAYLLGQREFYGHTFNVAPGVLIPRPETELLVDIARELLAPKVSAGRTAITDTQNATVLDLGTGSGCIAISIALACTDVNYKVGVTAIDASTDALTQAQANAKRMNANVRFIHSNWFAALADGAQTFDLIVSNPPYIAANDAHLSQGDLRHEPLSALASGLDGLDAIRHIIGHASAHLRLGGWLWLEHGYDQAHAVRSLLRSAGFESVSSRRDLAGIERVSGGCLD